MLFSSSFNQRKTYLYIKNAKISFVSVFVFVMLMSDPVLSGNPDAKRLYDDLLSNYNKLVRPVANISETVTVHLKLKLSQLIAVVSMLTSLCWILKHFPVKLLKLTFVFLQSFSSVFSQRICSFYSLVQ